MEHPIESMNRQVADQCDIARLIDHTSLKPEATYDAIRKTCEEAREYGFASVYVQPSMIASAVRCLAGSRINVGSVAGFPLGATISEVKAFEAETAILKGAREIDMVINIGALRSGDYVLVEQDIRLVSEVCHSHQSLCKVIIETVYLTDEEKISACRLAKSAGADFVKTSTGFGPTGAIARDVALMRCIVGPDFGVKAAGGIRDWKAFQEMVQAGANRIGTSASVKIVEEARHAPANTPPQNPRELVRGGDKSNH